jgi:hypothetical protein
MGVGFPIVLVPSYCYPFRRGITFIRSVTLLPRPSVNPEYHNPMLLIHAQNHPLELSILPPSHGPCLLSCCHLNLLTSPPQAENSGGLVVGCWFVSLQCRRVVLRSKVTFCSRDQVKRATLRYMVLSCFPTGRTAFLCYVDRGRHHTMISLRPVIPSNGRDNLALEQLPVMG